MTKHKITVLPGCRLEVGKVLYRINFYGSFKSLVIGQDLAQRFRQAVLRYSFVKTKGTPKIICSRLRNIQLTIRISEST